MTKRGIFYIMMSIVSLIIMIVGWIMCNEANSVWENQISQITSGLDITPIWWTSNRIWGVIYLIGGYISILIFGILLYFEYKLK
jgi:hypothetical protein